MLNLARKQSEIFVQVDSKNHPDLRLQMATLTDVEAAELMGAGNVRQHLDEEGKPILDEDGEPTMAIDMPYGEMIRLFKAKFIDLVGEDVTIGEEEEPFDPSDPEHLACLPVQWKMVAMAQLVADSSSISKEMAGNSRRQDSPSPGAGPSEDSPAESRAS